MAYESSPTTTVYASLQQAFDHMNVELFGGRLEQPVLTLQKKANSDGYFHAEQFRTRSEAEDVRSQLTLNPAAFAGRTDKSILSTLVHGMVHLQQFIEGDNPPKKNGHNVEWAEMMDAIGLTPTSTGQEGGKRTGAKMSHMIVPGGKFDLAADKLIESGWVLTWESYDAPKGEAKPRDTSKVKHSCGCGVNVWGKDGIQINCGLCGSEFLPAA